MPEPTLRKSKSSRKKTIGGSCVSAQKSELRPLVSSIKVPETTVNLIGGNRLNDQAHALGADLTSGYDLIQSGDASYQILLTSKNNGGQLSRKFTGMVTGSLISFLFNILFQFCLDTYSNLVAPLAPLDSQTIVTLDLPCSN